MNGKNIKIINDYSAIDKRVNEIITKVSEYNTKLEKSFIHEQVYNAYLYARDAHEGCMRLSGDPYIIHPIEATHILLTLKPDIETIQACILHDVIEDTTKTKEDIRKEFGDEVAFLCEGMSKLERVRYRGEEREVGSLRKMFIAMAEDLRVIFIKLSDRLHNMRTLMYHPNPEKRQRIALETLNIYAPIADRLGLYHLKNDLDEECFKILEPEEYAKIKQEFVEFDETSKEFENNVKKEIHVLLHGKLENYEIDFRIKSIYSVFKKLKKKGLHSIKDLYDFFGVRIIVQSKEDCYKVLGLVHSKWMPLPNRFKDYIALPKFNGYESLHTTVFGLLKEYRQQPTEIQIKTYQMKEYSDLGVAAHFQYKELGSKRVGADINWVNELKEITKNIGDNDFFGSLKVDVFKDRIFVFTPSGEVINLPHGSTSVDFAYYLHSDLGDHISIAKVNKKVYPLDKELVNGDIVEIVIDKNKKPSLFWLGFVKTIKAKNRIKAYLKKENKDVYRERGKEIMNHYLKNAGLKIFDKELSILKTFDGKDYPMEGRWAFLEQVGDFSLLPGALLKKIIKNNPVSGEEEKSISSSHNTEVNLGGSAVDTEAQGGIYGRIKSNYKEHNIVIGGEKNMEFILGSCCRNYIFSNIVAHINNKGEIVIHQRDCQTLQHVNTNRLLSAYLNGYQSDKLSVSLNIEVTNLPGVLKDVIEMIYAMAIEVDEVTNSKLANGNIQLSFKINIPNYDYILIERLIERIKMKFEKDFKDFIVKNMSL